MIELTEKEKKAIRKLELVAKIWPDSLWLYSANGSLNVMRYGEDGHPAMTKYNGVDPDYSVRTISIENDGGDW